MNPIIIACLGAIDSIDKLGAALVTAIINKASTPEIDRLLEVHIIHRMRVEIILGHVFTKVFNIELPAVVMPAMVQAAPAAAQPEKVK